MRATDNDLYEKLRNKMVINNRSLVENGVVVLDLEPMFKWLTREKFNNAPDEAEVIRGSVIILTKGKW